MTDTVDPRQALYDFEKNRAQLMNVTSQKQQLELQLKALEQASEELSSTSEKKVYKAVGNILILKDVADVVKDVNERKEIIDLRIKTLVKQEDSITKKLNQLKHQIESFQKQQADSMGGESTKIVSDKSSDKSSSKSSSSTAKKSKK